MNEDKYSVLMSVYNKENPDYLKESLNSVFTQNLKPDEVILIKDGPLTNALENVIDAFLNEFESLHVFPLEENMGLGFALTYGLKLCTNEIVFRMDTDDIAKNDRVSKQLEYLNKHPNVSILGSYVEEFTDDNEGKRFIKKVPLSDTSIKKMLKKKNAINHPSVVFRKSDILAAGGYIELNLNEDYYLWVRMAEKGYTFANIGDSLVKMRISDETYLRRGGLKYFIVQNSVYKYMRSIKYLTFYEYIYGYIVRFAFRVALSNKMRKLVYTRFLRKGV